jgi:hypothetical protein
MTNSLSFLIRVQLPSARLSRHDNLFTEQYGGSIFDGKILHESTPGISSFLCKVPKNILRSLLAFGKAPNKG